MPPIFKRTLADAVREIPTEHGKRLVHVFSHGTLKVEVYAPRGFDPQTPHSQDEAYFVVKGTGLLVSGTTRLAFEPGDFLFVPAGVDHRFENFDDDLLLWVVFYGPEGGEVPHV
jgi:mannose-6-phosphate isomerase-like protein (cupin superfamily)